jgi:hypothetical protein
MKTYNEKLRARAATYASRHKGAVPPSTTDGLAYKLRKAWLAGAKSALRK